MKIIIVGGVAGGMSAATRLRRLMADSEIIIFDKGPFVSFANCGLPYYVSGEISDKAALLLQTPESLKARFNLDVRPLHEVTSISPENHSLTVTFEGKTWTESYDKLILSPGAKPFIPEITGLDQAKNVFTLRNVPDLDRIMAHLTSETKTATVIGAGFIGLEMAENLSKRGLAVTLIEKAPQVLPPLDPEMAAYVKNELVASGVTVKTSASAYGFQAGGREIVLDTGEVIASDVTILAVGVQPETSLAQAAGLKLGRGGGILVDDHYQTSAPDIYAVGDAIVVKQQLTGQDALITLASPANRQGRQVADVIAGLHRLNRGSIGTAIVRIFGLTAASTGLNESQAKGAELPIAVVHITGKDHAAYYPGAKDLLLKLIFNPYSGEIYGAQGIGEQGVDKRIDIIATAIKGNLTIFDLPELELTYAPPFGSAKDPVNMLGYAAMNLAEGLSENIQWYELKAYLAQGYRLLDVRQTQELKQGRFPNALHIPLNDLSDRLSELDPDQAYIVSCQSGLRSYLAERLLKQAGFTVENLDGAFALYQTVLPEEIDYVSKHDHA